MKQALIYTLKLWLSAILLSPLLRLLMAWGLNLHLAQESLSYLEYGELAALYGLIFSVPAVIMLWIFIVIINPKAISVTEKKAYVSALVFIEMTLTFYYIFWLAGDIRTNVIMTIPYCAVTGVAIWFYKLKSVGVLRA